MVLYAAQEEKEEDINFQLTEDAKCSTSPSTKTARWEMLTCAALENELYKAKHCFFLQSNSQFESRF